MSKFKVGDVVRRTDEMPHGGMKKGDIGTVSEVKESGAIRFKEFDYLDRGYWWDNKSYELASPRSAQPDVKDMNLDELIECANRGADAAFRLQTSQLFIGKYEENKWQINISKFRKKPQKTFEPYTIESTGWKVRVTNESGTDTVHIGCKTFNARDLLTALRGLIVEGKTTTRSMNVHLYATMLGCRCEGHILPWPDAKELMKRLEDYLEGGE